MPIHLRLAGAVLQHVGGHDCFKGKGAFGDKNQYNLFCRKWGFEYFLFNNFFKNNNNNNFFWGGGTVIFERKGCRTTKMNITFSVANGVHSFFPAKTPIPAEWKPRKRFGGTFSPYQWCYWARCFQNKAYFWILWTGREKSSLREYSVRHNLKINFLSHKTSFFPAGHICRFFLRL